MVGSRVDITELKRVEEVRRESETRFRFLDARPPMVWTARAGLATNTMAGSTSASTRDWDRGSSTPTIATAASSDAAPRVNGRRSDATAGISAGRVRWFGSIIDIDDQKRTEEAERRAKEAAEAASRAKSEFLANVSHEIRTPMNAILGMTELAIDTPGSDEQRQYLTIVKSSADALLNVINDLLDFSKIEAGKLELDHAGFSLRGVLGETLRALALRPQERAGARLPDPAGRPRRPDRRCRAAPADPAQSRRQRDQVHRGG